jgi:ubiquinone/menaquinone biosynthesis C-methylase UbiE
MKKLVPSTFSPSSLPARMAGAGRRMRDWLASPRPKDLGMAGQQLLPYERYRRQKLLRLLSLQDFEQRSVLQVGCGVGDLLLEIAKYQPRELFAVDTSHAEVEMARQRLEEKGVAADFVVISEPVLPYPDGAFDVVLIVQQLQFIVEGKLLRHFMAELCRVSRQWLILIEDTDQKRRQREGYVRRPVTYYKEFYKKQKFHLRKIASLDVAATRSTVRWLGNPWQTLRWIFSPLLYLMGFPRQLLRRPAEANSRQQAEISPFMQKVAVWFGSGLDDVFKTGR